MLVTNPANRASLAEVMSHPWIVRGFMGSPAIHMVHREPLRADELDRQVIKGMKGFEFGTEEEIERKLVHVLESDAYIRALQYWERKRSIGNLNGNGSGTYNGTGSRFGESVSNSSLAISFDSANGKNDYASTVSSSGTTKKSRRFSGFDYYRRKLFSPASSPPGSPSSHSPPNSQRHLAHPSFSDSNREPLDPTRGFHPLISMYYLAREKLERDRVYGPGQFASSQLSISGDPANVNAASVVTPTNAEETMRQQQQYASTAQSHFTAPVSLGSPPNTRKDPTASTKAKADYSMPLPRLPAPETSHFSGMSYDNSVAPSPTTPAFAQPRARDLGLPPPSPSAAAAQRHVEIDQSATLGPKRNLPRAPPASTHRRSHSMSQRPTVLSRGWGGMFGGGSGSQSADESGVTTRALPEPPMTVGPDTSNFPERPPPIATGDDQMHERDHGGFSGATLVRKFGSMLVGGRHDDSRRQGSLGKRGTILGGLSAPSPRPSGDSRTPTEEKLSGAAAFETNEKENTAARDEDDSPTPVESSTPTPSTPTSKPLSSSLSQPIGNVHRRAATILDPQGRTTRHERRSSTGAAIMGNTGTIGRLRRPSTGYSSSGRPLVEKLFSSKPSQPAPGAAGGEMAEKREDEDEGQDDLVTDGEETFKEEDERHTSEKDFKPVFLKGLFRCVNPVISRFVNLRGAYVDSILQCRNHFN